MILIIEYGPVWANLIVFLPSIYIDDHILPNPPIRIRKNPIKSIDISSSGSFRFPLSENIKITINKHRRIFENRRRYLAKLFIMISPH